MKNPRPKYVVEIGRGGHEKLLADCETSIVAEEVLGKFLNHGINAYLSYDKPSKKHELYIKVNKDYEIIEEN